MPLITRNFVRIILEEIKKVFRERLDIIFATAIYLLGAARLPSPSTSSKSISSLILFSPPFPTSLNPVQSSPRTFVSHFLFTFASSTILGSPSSPPRSFDLRNVSLPTG